jgi:hypothetical protein
LARSDIDLLLALAGAIAASAGDLGLLWVAWAADGRFALPTPPTGTLLVGHYLGVLGIPLYGFGYRALGAGIADAAPAAACAVVRLGALGAVLGAVIHGLTGALTAVAERTHAPVAPDAIMAVPEAAYLLPLWLIVGAALVVGSLVFARAVWGGGTRFPRAFAFANPLLATLAIAALAMPSAPVAAFVGPAAPNLAHVVVFALALAIRERRWPA